MDRKTEPQTAAGDGDGRKTDPAAIARGLTKALRDIIMDRT